MKYLLDTCIISELIAKQPNPPVLDWIESQEPASLYLSVITIGEIAKGLSKLPDSRRKRTLTDWLERDLLDRFAGRTQALDLDTMLLWENLVGKLESQGRVLPLLDSLIAAIALQGSFHLVTRNIKDFDGISNIQVVNPFER
jgi:toxin FitB